LVQEVPHTSCSRKKRKSVQNWNRFCGGATRIACPSLRKEKDSSRGEGVREGESLRRGKEGEKKVSIRSKLKIEEEIEKLDRRGGSDGSGLEKGARKRRRPPLRKKGYGTRSVRGPGYNRVCIIKKNRGKKFSEKGQRGKCAFGKRVFIVRAKKDQWARDGGCLKGGIPDPRYVTP